MKLLKIDTFVRNGASCITISTMITICKSHVSVLKTATEWKNYWKLSNDVPKQRNTYSPIMTNNFYLNTDFIKTNQSAQNDANVSKSAVFLNFLYKMSVKRCLITWLTTLLSPTSGQARFSEAPNLCTYYQTGQNPAPSPRFFQNQLYMQWNNNRDTGECTRCIDLHKSLYTIQNGVKIRTIGLCHVINIYTLTKIQSLWKVKLIYKDQTRAHTLQKFWFASHWLPCRKFIGLASRRAELFIGWNFFH